MTTKEIWDTIIKTTEELPFPLPIGNQPTLTAMKDDSGKCKHELRISFLEQRSYVWCAKNCGYKVYTDKVIGHDKN